MNAVAEPSELGVNVAFAVRVRLLDTVWLEAGDTLN